MFNRIWFAHGLLAATLLVMICSGCGSSAPVAQNGPQSPAESVPGPPATSAVPGPPPASTIPGPPPASPPPASPAPQPAAAVDSGAPRSFPPSDGTPEPPPPPSTPEEVVKADVGVGAKGRSLDEYEGPLVTPAKAYFAVREKAIFQIAIPQAIQLYKAENPIPLTFDEFKQNILDPNKIKLPPLPPGHSYEWNPEEEQLMVRRPMK